MSEGGADLSVRDAWQQAFPFDEARRAARFLVETWQQVAPALPKFFNANVREDQLTELLCTYVENFSISIGRLTGQWSHEKRRAILDKNSGQIVKRIRKDITYFSNATRIRLDLIFEFKKLRDNKGSLRAYEGEDGMQRFVDGNYAIAEPLAAMVGMVIGEQRGCIDALRRSLSEHGQHAALRMVPSGDGEYLRDPSVLFPRLANFDTEHSRPSEQATAHGTIMLAHIFVSLVGQKD